MMQLLDPEVVSCVVNADDLGISQEVNDRIFQLMDQGHLRSASLMMNGPFVEDAVNRLSRYKNCSFGVHLNITYLKPLKENQDLRPILGADGQFTREFPWHGLSLSVQEAIFQEWSNQIEKAKTMGVPVSHLDSHHHVHLIPDMFVWLTLIQCQHEISRLRGGWAAVLGQQTSYPFGHKYAHRKARTTEAFSSLYDFMNNFGHGQPLPNQRLWELMTHPGSPNDQDTALLTGPWRERLAFPVEIKSFNEI